MSSGDGTHVPLKAGDIIGERYRVLEQLGAGGMGTVYRVEHTLMSKTMAMKLLRPELSVVPQIAERFEREAKSASRLDNPHIVRVTDFGRAPNGSLFLVMELLDGESLSAFIAKGAMPHEDALDIVDQILAALEHAHANGVVHRDLKPDNIMLVPRDGRTIVKILDFGLAKLTTEGSGPTLTQTGMVFGTPRYMAPEQAAAEPMDARTDLYSIGVLTYEMLTGKPPFDAANAVDLLTCHLTQAPPPLELALDDRELASALEAIVFRSMQKHKKDRFQTATEFREAVNACRVPGAVAVAAVALPRSTSTGGVRISQVPGAAMGTGAFGDTAISAKPRRSSSVSSVSSLKPALGGSIGKTPVLIGASLAAVLVAGAIFSFGSSSPSDPQTRMVTRAEEALANGDLPAARAVLGQLVAQDADAPRTQVLIGHLAFAENDLEGAVSAYKHALELDGSTVGDPVLAANVRRIVEKNPKNTGTLVIALALHADSSGAALLADIAQNAPAQRMRSHAYQALERLNETNRLNVLDYLAGELDKVRAESCKTRKWYVDRLAVLDDARVLPVLKRERARRGGILNLENVNGCMQQDLAAYIAKHEKKAAP